MKKLGTLCAVILVLLLLLAPIGCQQEPPPAYTVTESGMLPVRYVGDQWVYRITEQGEQSTETQTVIDEEMVSGRDCYIIEHLYDPPVKGLTAETDKVTICLDKATLDVAKMQLSWEYMGQSYSSSTTISYSPWTSIFPLVVGAEHTMVFTGIQTATVGSETQTNTAPTMRIIKIVESIEEVTVPAGTFRCFKIAFYEEDGNLNSTHWYSDEVKNEVKIEFHSTNKIKELISYSIQ